MKGTDRFMKRFIMFAVMCGLLTVFATGCADMAESWPGTEDSREAMSLYSAQVAKTAAPIEEGYYMVEGKLSEINKSGFLLETEDGQTLYFKLAPETIIYAGENKEIFAGQNIKVVFDGELMEEGMEKVSVIAVTLLEE